MLTRDNKRVRQLAGEGIAAAVVDALTYRVRIRVDRCVANVGAVVVLEVNDGE